MVWPGSRCFMVRPQLTPHFIFPTRALHGVAVAVTMMDVMDAPPDSRRPH